MDHMNPMYKPNEPMMHAHYANPPMYVHAANVPAPAVAPGYGWWTSTAAILVLFILLVIVSRNYLAGV